MRLTILFLFLSSAVCAQSSILSGGGLISNSGSISYSIGQVFVAQQMDASGSVSLGVQQPFEIMTLSLEDIVSKNGYHTYPNPTTGFFMLQLKNTTSFPYQLKLYDLRGRLVKNQKILKNNMPIDISKSSVGVYLLQLSKDGKPIYSSKILKN